MEIMMNNVVLMRSPTDEKTLHKQGQYRILPRQGWKGGGGRGSMSPVWSLKRLVSVFINACRLLSASLQAAGSIFGE